MRQRERISIAFILCLGLPKVPFLHSSDGLKPTKPDLEHFYVVSMRVSDASPFWFDYVFDVRTDGDGVVIRAIRIAPENETCAKFVEVKVVEKRLPGLSLSQVVKHINLCSIRETDVDRAIANAQPRNASITESERLGIVAQCQNSERLFTLPHRETIDMAGLKRNSPKIAALYGLESQIYRRAFGKKDVFYLTTPAEDLEMQRFGAALVAELRAGMYDLGFADENSRKLCRGVSSCTLGLTSDLLKRYEGPDHKPHVPTVTLIDPEQYHLAKYVAPEFPQLAKLAQIQGKVDLEISADRATGTVKQVHANSGHPLLRKYAEKAVKEWVFRATDGSLSGPVSAVLNFSLGCEDAPSQQHSP